MRDRRHGGGLARDLEVLFRGASRREFLRLAGAAAGAGLLPAAGCLGSNGGGTNGGGGTACPATPEETAGPFPGDGTVGPDALSLGGIVRSDIRASIAGASGVAEGVPLVLALTLVSAELCEPRSGYAVYVWHCDREGRYSLYSPGATEENYLRGVQEADGAGKVTFTTIFPGCYPGRMPHVHFHVYPLLDSATGEGEPILTSQLTFPAEECERAYAAAGYEASAANLSQVSFASDGVFRDGTTRQMVSLSGSAGRGFQASLQVHI